MSKKNYPPTAKADWTENIGIGQSLGSDAVNEVGDEWDQLGKDLADDAREFFGAINGGQHDWKGKGFDAFHDEGERLKDSVSTNSTEGFEPYGKDIQNHATNTAQAEHTIANNSEYEYGTDNSAKADAVANALQTLYHPPGEDAFKELDYVPSPQAPIGGLGSGGGSGGGSSGSGGGPSGPGGGPGPDLPQHASDSADLASTLPSSSEQSADGKPAGDDKAPGGLPSGSSPEGAGAGSRSGGSGGPPGGGPSGPPPGGMDPQGSATPAGYDLGADASSLPDGVDATGAGGGFVGAGGVGGLGSGDRERPLSAKTSNVSGGQRFSFNVPKTNVPPGGVIGGGMGGAMAPGAAGGKPGDKEHKTPDYLKNKEHGRAMLGDALPTVSPEVIGELNANEIKEMEHQAKEQDDQQKKQPEPPPAVPKIPDGPQPRPKAGQS